jgi:hypothetical protein
LIKSITEIDGNANIDYLSVLDRRLPLPSIAGDKLTASGIALTGANDIGNAASLNYKYPSE